jgi:hypothetical protein
MPKFICFKLLKQADRLAFSRALAKTGKRMEASKLIIATTTRSFISVNPRLKVLLVTFIFSSEYF